MRDVETTQQPDTAGQVTLVRHMAPVVVGGVITLALTIVTASWLAARGLQTPLVLDATYRGVFIVLGSHLAARLAPPGNPRIRYAIALGVMLTLINVLAASSAWGQAPRWYLLSGIALPIPCAIIGGGTGAWAMGGQGKS